MTALRVDRGETIELTVGPVLDENDVVQDLTGSTIRFTAKERLSDLDAAAIITGSTADGRIVIPSQAGPLRGYAYVAIPASATSGFTAKRVLHWDVQISQPGGRVKTLAKGLLYVELDVTQTV